MIMWFEGGHHYWVCLKIEKEGDGEEDGSKLSGTFVAASNRLLKGIFDDELKATYQEVSFKIRAIVAGDGISQEELHKMLKNADMHLKFLNDIVEEVEKDTKIFEKSISDDAEARRQESLFISNFINNQAGTSSSNDEDKNGSSEDDWVSSHLLQAGTSSFSAEDKNGSSEDDWVSNEISKRLDTHVCLKRFLNRLIGMFDRKIGTSFKLPLLLLLKIQESLQIVLMSPNNPDIFSLIGPC